MKFQVTFTSCLAFTIHFVSSTILIPYNYPSKCDKTSYFQYSSLQCVPCGENKMKSLDSLSCRCDNGFYIKKYNGGPELSCRACNHKEVTSKDGWHCVKCVNDMEYKPIQKLCSSCPPGTSVIERHVNGTFFADRRQRCLSCESDTESQSRGRICQRCNSLVLEINSRISCQCQSGIDDIIQEDGICFSSSTPLISNLPSTYTVEYSNGKTVESQFFRTHLRAAQALCKKYENYTSCQLLGNLCVINMYSGNKISNLGSFRTDACEEYLKIVGGRKTGFVNRLIDWPVTMPWLFYKVDKPLEVLDATDITTKFERRQNMKFAFVSYDVRGNFLGISKISSILNLCPVDNTFISKAFEFTTSYKIQCKLTLKELMAFNTVFYDMYIFLNDDKLLYPVPLLVRNIALNQKNDRSNWILTRRFFLVDNISGQPARSDKLLYIQYAKNIELNIRLQEDGKIYPPLLKVLYDTVEVSNNHDKNLEVEFSVSYEMNTKYIKKSIEIAVGVLSSLGIIYAGVRIVCWRRRENLEVVDCTSLVIFLIYVCSALSLVFLTVIFFASLQWLFFFKQQTVVIRLLPTSSQEKLLKDLLISAIVFKIADVIYIIYSQINIDVFFIDWERPRGVVIRNAEDGKNHATSQVSIMRTLFVANEWREVQTARRIKPTLQIILVIFFMKVVGLEYWSTSDPISRTSINESIDYVGEVNFTLRLAVISLIYLLIGLSQWIIFGFIFERFVADVMGDFIDFCSMSNISLFILSRSHYGYYIHGRSVHGRSDTSLHELYEQFQREEENLCGKRGLEANTDRQTFEIALTMKFKNEYSKIKQPLLSRDNQGPRTQMTSRQNPGLPGSHLSPGLERSVAAYNTMNKYLSSFIEHAIQDNGYIVKDKFLMEKLLQNELQSPIDKCIFYNDDSRAFAEILLYGQEWNLFIMNWLIFIVVDWISNWNIFLAATVTYFFDILLVVFRDSMGKKNLANKTMVDERFLI